jgi:hypothetical protein
MIRKTIKKIEAQRLRQKEIEILREEEALRQKKEVRRRKRLAAEADLAAINATMPRHVSGRSAEALRRRQVELDANAAGSF